MPDPIDSRVREHTRARRNHAFAFRSGIHPHRACVVVLFSQVNPHADPTREGARRREVVLPRYYNPTTGQLLTSDPLVAETRSAYGYAVPGASYTRLVYHV